MFTAIDINQNRIDILDSEEGALYFCPVCSEPVITAKGSIYAHHFKHKKGTKCIDPWKYDMSEWHRSMQLLFDEQYREIVVTHENETHRADILKDGTVIEFQHSPISKEEYLERTNFYLSCGYKLVWVIDITESFQKNYICDGLITNIEWKCHKKYLDFTPDIHDNRDRLSVCLYWTDSSSGYSLRRVTDIGHSFQNIDLSPESIQLADTMSVEAFIPYIWSYEEREKQIEEARKRQVEEFRLAKENRKRDFIKYVHSLGKFNGYLTGVRNLGYSRKDTTCPLHRGIRYPLDLELCSECEYCGAIEMMNSDSPKFRSFCVYCYQPLIVNPDHDYIETTFIGRFLNSRK